MTCFCYKAAYPLLYSPRQAWKILKTDGSRLFQILYYSCCTTTNLSTSSHPWCANLIKAEFCHCLKELKLPYPAVHNLEPGKQITGGKTLQAISLQHVAVSHDWLTFILEIYVFLQFQVLAYSSVSTRSLCSPQDFVRPTNASNTRPRVPTERAERGSVSRFAFFYLTSIWLFSSITSCTNKTMRGSVPGSHKQNAPFSCMSKNLCNHPVNISMPAYLWGSIQLVTTRQPVLKRGTCVQSPNMVCKKSIHRWVHQTYWGWLNSVLTLHTRYSLLFWCSPRPFGRSPPAASTRWWTWPESILHSSSAGHQHLLALDKKDEFLSLNKQGQVVHIWHNDKASLSKQILFGSTKTYQNDSLFDFTGHFTQNISLNLWRQLWNIESAPHIHFSTTPCPGGPSSSMVSQSNQSTEQ